MLIIGSRGSKLALWQAHWVKERLEQRHPHLEILIRIIKTTGDKIADFPLARVTAKGIYVQEIEESLRRKQVHLAVHSLKDLPTELPPGLVIGAITQREDPRDALVCRNGVKALTDLPRGAVLATGSLRRQSQILHLRPDLQFRGMRGNIDTRMAKLHAQEELDGIVLATAGLVRLGYEQQIAERLSPEVVLPAVGQGALAVECLADDQQTLELIQFLNHPPTSLAVGAERACLLRLGGGCQVPIAALGTVEESRLTLSGMVAAPDGSRLLRDQVQGPAEQAESLGRELGEKLIAAGADQVLCTAEAHTL
ncbi:MAG: hydroxymethylbilane synthase [Acidobacteria bacterium]|nr:hydroxymethylbilane synthase [Acidobacteriota bacterium]